MRNSGLLSFLVGSVMHTMARLVCKSMRQQIRLDDVQYHGTLRVR